MKSITKVLLIALLGFSTSAFASEASHRAAAERFFKAMEMQKLMSMMADQLLIQQLQMQPCARPVEATIRKYYQDTLNYKNFENEFIDLYTKALSESDLIEVSKFYESDVGKRIMNALPELTQEAGKISMKHVQKTQDAFVKTLQDAYEKLDPKDVPEACKKEFEASKSKKVPDTK